MIEMKFLVVLIMFFVIGALFIISNNNLAFYNPKNVESFFKLYYEWIDEIYENLYSVGKDLISSDWIP